MKKLIFIHGTMGVGKTALCKNLYKQLDGSVWLDGDWCWLMHPFIVSEENKNMVQDNIKHILSSYLENSSFTYIIFSWVIHREEIFDSILEGLQRFQFQVYKITLICSEVELEKRMVRDGRMLENIKNSLARIELYKNMDTLKIDTTNLTIDETIREIHNIIHVSI